MSSCHFSVFFYEDYLIFNYLFDNGWAFAKAALFCFAFCNKSVVKKAKSSPQIVKKFKPLYIYIVAKHILQENVWESNLISDIAGVDCIAGNQGRTNLQPLDGLAVFVDDFYVYGSLMENQIGWQGFCITGEEGSAKRVLLQISLFFREVWGDEDGFKNVAITVDAKSRSSRIVATVEKIRKRNRLPRQTEMGGATPPRGSRCLFCCQGGCFGVANGKAAERPAVNAALFGDGWLGAYTK